MHILGRPSRNHHDSWLDLHFFHLYHEFLIWIFLNLSAHDKPVFEEFVLFEKLLVSKCFLNLEHPLLLFFILSPFLDYEVSILARVSLQLEVKRVALILQHFLSQRSVWLVRMVVVPDGYSFANVLL